MGIEYEIRVPDEDHAAVASALASRLVPLLKTLDPSQGSASPHVSIAQIPGGVYVCDHLSDKAVASQVIRGLIDLLLSCSAQVSVVES